VKTALCFTGTARSLQYTHNNIKEKLINSLEECDIFAFLAENPHAYKFKDLLGDNVQIKKIIIEEELDCDISKIKFAPGWPPKTSSREIYIKMIRSRQRCEEILSLYEKEEGVNYERVIFSRLDVKYFDDVGPHVKNLNHGCLYVPDFHNTFGGVIEGHNDRFAIGNRKDMRIYFNVPNSIEEFNKKGGQITAETLLKWHLERSAVQVEKIPLRFTRVRATGEEIDLRLKDRSLHPRDT
jgi:hypothetical protein